MACRHFTWREIERRADKALGCAVSPYRSKFSDCPADAVPNSYPKLDLLWDNVIAGPWGWLRSTVLAQVPARHPAMRRVGTLTICPAAEFQIKKCNPLLADELVMTRPNPVRRDKSRPPVSSPRRSEPAYRCSFFGGSLCTSCAQAA